MREMAIAIDLDDTIANTTLFFIKELNKRRGTNYALEDFNERDFDIIGSNLSEYNSITREG